MLICRVVEPDDSRRLRDCQAKTRSTMPRRPACVPLNCGGPQPWTPPLPCDGRGHDTAMCRVRQMLPDRLVEQDHDWRDSWRWSRATGSPSSRPPPRSCPTRSRWRTPSTSPVSPKMPSTSVPAYSKAMAHRGRVTRSRQGLTHLQPGAGWACPAGSSLPAPAEAGPAKLRTPRRWCPLGQEG